MRAPATRWTCACLLILSTAACSGQQGQAAGTADGPTSEFCSVAEAFATQGIRGQEQGNAGGGEAHRHDGGEAHGHGHEESDLSAQLNRLAEVAPADLRDPLRQLVQLSAEGRTGELSAGDAAAADRIGDEVGKAIESRCAVHLPGID